VAEERARQNAIFQQQLQEDKAKDEAKLRELDDQIRIQTHQKERERLAAERERQRKQKEEDLKATQPNPSAYAPTQSPITSRSRSSTSTPSAGSVIQPFISMISSAFPYLNPFAVDQSSLSPSQKEWARQKRVDRASNEHIDKMMAMIGLETVKTQFLNVKAEIEVGKRQNTDMSKKNLNVALLGNPGTGEILAFPLLLASRLITT
jgi:hypothetical protein